MVGRAQPTGIVGPTMAPSPQNNQISPTLNTSVETRTKLHLHILDAISQIPQITETVATLPEVLRQRGSGGSLFARTTDGPPSLASF